MDGYGSDLEAMLDANRRTSEIRRSRAGAAADDAFPDDASGAERRGSTAIFCAPEAPPDATSSTLDEVGSADATSATLGEVGSADATSATLEEAQAALERAIREFEAYPGGLAPPGAEEAVERCLARCVALRDAAAPAAGSAAEDSAAAARASGAPPSCARSCRRRSGS